MAAATKNGGRGLIRREGAADGRAEHEADAEGGAEQTEQARSLRGRGDVGHRGLGDGRR